MQINSHVRIHTHGPRDRSITRPTAHHAGFTFFLSPGERLPYHRVQTTSSTTRGATINIPKKRTTRTEDRADGAPIDRSLDGVLLCDASVERVRSFVRSLVGCFFCVCVFLARGASREIGRERYERIIHPSPNRLEREERVERASARAR